MSTERDFEIETEKINLIYFKARQSFEIYKYICDQKGITDPFWIQIMYLSFKDSIIELDKLFSENKNQKFRINNLLNKLKKTGQYKNYNFDKRTLLNWENELLRFNSVLGIVRNLRDQHFAHTDKNDSIGINTSSSDYRNIINNSEIENLFDFIKKVLIEVYSKCKNVHLETELFFIKSNIKIFENLEYLNSFRRIELQNKLKR